MSAPMISAVSIFRYGVKSTALHLQSPAREVQSPACRLQFPVINFQSPALGFQSLALEGKSPTMILESLAVETRIRKNGGCPGSFPVRPLNIGSCLRVEDFLK
jgi:hypothetical protein